MKKLFMFLSVAFVLNVNAQSGIGNTSPNVSAKLDVSSTNKGLLIPRVSLSSLTDASTITSPATSLLIYNTNTSTTSTRGAGYYYNAGTSSSPNWVKFTTTTDTVVQTVTPSGNVVKLDRFPMGELSMNGNTAITQISTLNTWTKVAGTTTIGGAYQFTTEGVSNRLQYTGPYMKMFHIACTLSVKGANNDQNGTMKAVLFKNGVALTNGIIQQRLNGDADIASTAIHVMTSMNTNDYLELYVLNVSNTGDFIITEMNLFAMGVSMGMDQ